MITAGRASLRRQVVLAATLVMTLAGGAGILVVDALIEERLREDFDHLVATHLHGVVAASEFEQGVFFNRHNGGPEVLVAAWDGPRRLIGPPWMTAPAVTGPPSAPTLGDGQDPGGSHYRLAWAMTMPHDDEHRHQMPVAVGVGVPTAGLEQRIVWIGRILVTTGILIALAAIAALIFALHFALRPLDQLAAGITALDPRRPGQRLVTTGLVRELAPLAERVNQLCDRLEEAHGLASSIRGVAAHELRTPLAGLRATIEVVSDAGGDAHQALATCHAITLQMQSRVDNLLIAARLDAGQLAPRRDEVDLVAIAEAVWADHAGRSAVRGQTVTWQHSGSGLAEADPEAVRMVFSNLIDNAVSHCPQGGSIELAISEDGAFASFAVLNPAPFLAEGDASVIFARGWRNAGGGDEGRHAGLGMAICRELVGLMRGSISAQVVAGRLRIEVRLPNAGTDIQYW